MKKIVLLALILTPLLGYSQYDFETRYFTITAADLPEIDQETPITFSKHTLFSKKLKALKMNQQNYRIPVDMSAVVEELGQYVDHKLELPPPIKSRSYGFSVSVRGSNSFDGLNARGRVQNIVYQEMRGLFVCSPYGYQPRRN